MLRKFLSITLAFVISLGAISIPARAAGVSVTLNKTVYAANEDIKISLSGITDDMVKAGTFIGLYESGAAYNKSLKQSTLKAGSSTVTMKAPATTGKYEVRVYQRGAPCLKKVQLIVETSTPVKTQAPTPTSKPNPTPEPSKPIETTKPATSGSTDEATIGSWRYSGVMGGGTYWYFYDFNFKEDGSFSYYYTADSRTMFTTATVGKFSASDGKVYMTEIEYLGSIGDATSDRVHYDDIVHEYETGTDDLGEYLKIGSLGLATNTTYKDISLGVKFRRLSVAKSSTQAVEVGVALSKAGYEPNINPTLFSPAEISIENEQYGASRKH